VYKKYIKTVLDILIASIGLIVLLPIFLILMVVIAITNRGTPFFVQTRPGKNGKLFSLLKFKTMHDARDASGSLLPDSQRITIIGKFIRSTSLDELPQLINVIKGDMSIIGPRPLLPEYLSLYNDFQKQRHNVKPGITGWAQVNGRNEISWEEKFILDVFYVKNCSFALDAKIFFLTIKKVLLRKGINTNNATTMHRFKGSK
jgi:lipopolysaccharide/colanic/teichoic acid biosynthesis glycosyltransferase